jgi:hypothetical protein
MLKSVHGPTSIPAATAYLPQHIPTNELIGGTGLTVFVVAEDVATAGALEVVSERTQAAAVVEAVNAAVTVEATVEMAVFAS